MEGTGKTSESREKKTLFFPIFVFSSSAFVVMNSGEQMQTSQGPLKKQVPSGVEGNPPSTVSGRELSWALSPVAPPAGTTGRAAAAEQL